MLGITRSKCGVTVSPRSRAAAGATKAIAKAAPAARRPDLILSMAVVLLMPAISAPIPFEARSQPQLCRSSCASHPPLTEQGVLVRVVPPTAPAPATPRFRGFRNPLRAPAECCRPKRDAMRLLRHEGFGSRVFAEHVAPRRQVHRFVAQDAGGSLGEVAVGELWNRAEICAYGALLEAGRET